MRPRRGLHALLVVAVLLLAGCVANGPAPSAETGDPGSSAPATARALYLTGAPGLATAAPTGDAPEEVRGGNFFTQWGATEGYADFLGDPLEATVIVTGNASITAFARADGPAVQAGVFPHFIAYFGTEESLMADSSADANPVLVSGDTVQVTFPLNLPRDGLLLEKGARPRVLLVAVMTQDDRSGDITFLVNATSTPSSVSFDAEPVADPAPVAPGEPVSEDGRLIGSAYAATQEGFSQATRTLQIPPGTGRVVVTLTATSAAGFADLDLAVLDGSGEEVARSVTPLGTDRVVLHPHQFPAGGATYRVTATNYGSATATYTIEWEVAPLAPDQ